MSIFENIMYGYIYDYFLAQTVSKSLFFLTVPRKKLVVPSY